MMIAARPDITSRPASRSMAGSVAGEIGPARHGTGLHRVGKRFFNMKCQDSAGFGRCKRQGFRGALFDAVRD